MQSIYSRTRVGAANLYYSELQNPLSFISYWYGFLVVIINLFINQSSKLI